MPMMILQNAPNYEPYRGALLCHLGSNTRQFRTIAPAFPLCSLIALMPVAPRGAFLHLATIFGRDLCVRCAAGRDVSAQARGYPGRNDVAPPLPEDGELGKSAPRLAISR